ncbi:MAG: cytochrome C oxidase subunit IV family protein [Lewinellaceae bacterium]|nr:cytochrome C oxidase subunit IV family protein [Lewinellaceae bacterium]
MGLSYSASKTIATKTILILAGITIFEVLFALLGKGILVDGVHFPFYVTGFVMIVFSVVKAYLIIYEFMHMKYEVPALVKSVLVPTLLLVWAVIAFLVEGRNWLNNRANAHNDIRIEQAVTEGTHQ